MNFRPDIQAIRALAVSLVLIFHIWPAAIPGGYVGVDVFFVISGFLITGLLVREIERSGQISLSQFYLRRAARLLPASLLVLGFVVLGTAIIQPRLFWTGTAWEVIAAALYVENWYLHFQSLDYLAGDAAASPVQHFWSLGVEEQFYLIWPWAVLAGLGLAAPLRGHRPISGIRLMLGIVVITSFVYALWSAAYGTGGPGYFSTLTRAWQLGIGGLLAIWGGSRLGAWAMPLGFLGVLASALMLDTQTNYPGWWALAPTLSAAVMLAGGHRYGQPDLKWMLGGRPVQFLGDISYSLYLWHWPLIVFATLLYGGVPIGGWGLRGLVLAAIAIILAAATKWFVEDRFRVGHGSRIKVPNLISGLTSGSVALLLTAGFLPVIAGGWSQQSQQIAEAATYPGAAVFDGAPWDEKRTDFIPTLEEAGKDLADGYKSKCIQGVRESALKHCIYGENNSKIKIALIGDSHAGNWLPAFQRLTEEYSVQINAMSKSGCLFSKSLTYNRVLEKYNEDCLNWSQSALEHLVKEKYDFVIIAQASMYIQEKGENPSQSIDKLANGIIDMWREVEKTGTKTISIQHTPWQITNVPECAAKEEFPFKKCTSNKTRTIPSDAFSHAIKISKLISLNLSKYFCINDDCPAVIGGVLIYRDKHHITKTYMETLMPALKSEIEKLGITLAPRALSSTPH